MIKAECIAARTSRSESEYIYRRGGDDSRRRGVQGRHIVLIFSLSIFCEPQANCNNIAELDVFVLDVDFDYDSNGLVFISLANFIHLTRLFYVRGIGFLML